MNRVARALLWSALLWLPATGRAVDGWAQLRRGMNAGETKAAIGEPLLVSEGYGFAVWIYDHGTEVVFYDRVIAWTAPGARRLLANPEETWSFFQAAPGSAPAPVPSRQRVARDQGAFYLPVMMSSSFRYQSRP